MKKIITLLGMVISTIYANAQEEMQFDNLIKGYNFKLLLKEGENQMFKNIGLKIYKAGTSAELIKDVSISGEYGVSKEWYSDENNIEEEWRIVVKDYNFDGKLDFAILTDRPMPGFPGMYTFYLQNGVGNFDECKAIAGDMPERLSAKTKTLYYSTFVGGGQTEDYTIRWLNGKPVKSKSKYINH